MIPTYLAETVQKLYTKSAKDVAKELGISETQVRRRSKMYWSDISNSNGDQKEAFIKARKIQ